MADKWTHAICEVDWIGQRGTRGPLGELVSVDRPHRVKVPEGAPSAFVERCCRCGAPTIVGIYQRGAPDSYLCGGAPGWGPTHGDADG